MTADFKAIDRIFAAAEADGRAFLFEHEVYALLAKAGVAVPKHRFVPKGTALAARDLAGFKSGELVLKIVAPLIQHKTDVGGVAFVKNGAAAVNAGVKAMRGTVPARFRAWLKGSAHRAGAPVPAIAEIEADIRGVLVCEKVAFEKFGLGTEILVGIRNTREFGPVMTVGAGGVEVEFLNERLKEGTAAAIASPHLIDKKRILAHLDPLAVTAKLIKPFRGRPAVLAPAALRETYARLAALAAHYSPFAGARYVIEEAEVNPFVVRDGALVPLDGLCRFSRAHVGLKGRPFAEIARLLHPASVAVIGVSERMNIGHIILNNILKMGFPRERVYVVKPGLAEIEGCRCVPDIASLPETVDMFVLTLGADQCPDVVAELVSQEKARSVILIAGGMGEKQGGASNEDKIVRILAEGRAAGRVTPVINGGNCLGIYSKPGRYDTTFIPEAKLRFPKVECSNLAYISQSGAFMISRISKLTRIEPLYAISFGNQIDLRVSDFLNYLKGEPEVKTFAVYMEGFKPGDGYLVAAAAREILKDPSRSIVAYKSGRSAEGRLATSSHTASVAGEYGVCKAALEAAGVFVAETLFEFESLLLAFDTLEGRPVRGNRVGLISNAGFESVCMSDSLGEGRDRLVLAPLVEATRARLAAALTPLGIDKLQDIKNPLDTTPVADDAVFAACARTILEDPGVDCAVVSPVPMTAAMQTLPAGSGLKEDIADPSSTPSRLIALFRATDKPFVVNIDSGATYDPMAAMLADAGVPVFRRSDEAMRFLRRYIGARLGRRT